MYVSALHVYPVKACRGVAVTTAELEPRGLADDRRWMVVDGNARFVSQREHPRMALVDVQVEGEQLVLAAPGLPSISVPRRGHVGASLEVVIWRAQVSAHIHPAASQWFSQYLGFDCQLVYMPDTSLRAVNPLRSRPGDIVSFADAYPCLVASEPSLAALNARLAQPISLLRFRPNIVIAGCAPFAEDTWQRVRFGNLELRWAKACDRCTVTTVDPTTGTRGKEPLATLATFRRRDNEVWFGGNFIPDSFGRLNVGDPITVIEAQPAWIE